MQVLARDGFERARMLDIAEAAGAAKDARYNCFESKEQLHAAIIRECPPVLLPQEWLREGRES